MTDFYTFDYDFDYDWEDYQFPRLAKRSSTKYTTNNKQAATRRNPPQYFAKGKADFR